ncbi:MAG: SRPBCC domain-containing protein [Deltaproteobacteria bacterium]|nr:SRPBCC domain-containing protein [Deltaproteobacteria bacterium]
MAASANQTYDRNLSVSRVYDAPRRLVFEAWTKPEHLKQWFAPRPYTLPHCEVDLRVGGTWRYAMRSPSGDEHWVTATYREIVELERLVMMTEFGDMPGVAFEQRITFADEGAATKVTFEMTFPEPASLTPEQFALFAPRLAGAKPGSTQTLAQLAELVAKLR